MAKTRYYAVKAGKVPGVYTTWAETEAQVKGFNGAIHKSFGTNQEAIDFISGNVTAIPPAKKQITKPVNSKIIIPSISVDAACSGNPGMLEYRGVDTETKMILFTMGPFPKGTNNLGEYLALVHGLSYLEKNNLDCPIYTDSGTGMAWLKKGRHNSTAALDANSMLYKLVSRADILADKLYKKYQKKIIKWDTRNWGEIPADFGRK